MSSDSFALTSDSSNIFAGEDLGTVLPGFQETTSGGVSSIAPFGDVTPSDAQIAAQGSAAAVAANFGSGQGSPTTTNWQNVLGLGSLVTSITSAVFNRNNPVKRSTAIQNAGSTGLNSSTLFLILGLGLLAVFFLRPKSA